MPEEVELKLDLTPEAADALETSGLFGAPASRIDQRSRYFDTPDWTLFQSGLTLRIRKSGSKRMQTVKANGGQSAGLFARPEWERAVSGDTPVIDEQTPVAALLKDGTEHLSRLFEVKVERRIWTITDDVAMIEVALDRGEVHADGRAEPLCELELELKAGDVDALFALARRIDAVAPVRLSSLSKAERGYRLLGKLKSAYKAEPVPLDPAMTVAATFQAIARSCLRQYRLNEAILFERREAAALHQARVALRRLRSAMSIFKAVTDDVEMRRLKDALRDLSTTLGKARNLDVLIERAGAGELAERLGPARDAAYAEVEQALAADRTRRLMLDFAQWLGTGKWLHYPDTRELRETPATEFAANRLTRLRRKAKKDGRHLVTVDDEARHELRKDAKKLRYAAEFFALLFTGRKQRRRHSKFVDAMEKLQDQLGALNDLVTAPDVLTSAGLSDHPDAAALAGGANKTALLEAAADAHDELVDARKFWT